MKRIYFLAVAILAAGSTFAQTDTTNTNDADTVRIGNYTIIKKAKSNTSQKDVIIERKPNKVTGLSTNWLIFDLGFANVNDRTNYSSPEAMQYLDARGGQAFAKEDLKLRSGKTSNVNLWIIMQKLNIHKGYVNLKYGVGLEMFNFRYEKNISYRNDPTAHIFRDSVIFTKNKLYAGYVSVPLMININTTPGRKKGLSFSAGVSAGYLIGSRNKQISGERGKEKIRGDFDLEKFRLAYVGEIGIGPIRLFGSYSMTPLHSRGLDQYPYSLGIRFSNW